ncbi:MAG TPA: sigma-70 family RNA polymerase sigma factor [Caulifigura sp.]|nr:sigma-70 family RNA polymerase sigma factor [Caulifigura sp.]
MSDGELVRQVLTGQATAREELARVWSSRVLAMCRARVGRTAGEDVAQEALAKAFHELHQLSDPDRFGGWIRSIAIRACLDWHRHRVQTARLVASASQSAARVHASNDLERSEEQSALWDAITELPEELREVLLLFYCDNQSYDAIADWLEVSRSTVNSRLAKARDCIRRKLMTRESERDRGLCNRT